MKKILLCFCAILLAKTTDITIFDDKNDLALIKVIENDLPIDLLRIVFEFLDYEVYMHATCYYIFSD